MEITAVCCCDRDQVESQQQHCGKDQNLGRKMSTGAQRCTTPKTTKGDRVGPRLVFAYGPLDNAGCTTLMKPCMKPASVTMSARTISMAALLPPIANSDARAETGGKISAPLPLHAGDKGYRVDDVEARSRKS